MMSARIRKGSKGKKVFVAMSGGVDSSVVAGILKERGYDVVGVTMCFNITYPNGHKPSCCGINSIEDARRVSQILDIPHYVLNFSKEINSKIIDYFIDEYLNGRTPNPCVRCNQYLKFGFLYDKVMHLGADYLATGHYAKIQYNSEKRIFELRKGRDRWKDQSYFLYSIKKKILSKILFPLGDFVKDQVRELAQKYKLNTAQKPESQDICFIPKSGYKKFIEDRLGKEIMIPGYFKDEHGNIVGRHKGIANYTVGQRDKLGIALGYPVYVYHIEPKTNTVYVGDRSHLYARGLIASHLNLVNVEIFKGRIPVKVKIRYNQPEVDGYLTCLGGKRFRVNFVEPQKSVTPGQSVVCYDGEIVLAGGIIESSISDKEKKI